MYMVEKTKTNKKTKSMREKKGGCTPHTFNKKVVELFEILVVIYEKHGEKEEFTIASFKSSLSLYLGFLERNINSRFNLLASMGIITVYKRDKRYPLGKVFFHPEKLLELYNSPIVRKIFKSKQQAVRAKTEKELIKISKGFENE